MPDTVGSVENAVHVSNRDEIPCTCGIGTMSWAHLHQPECPFSKRGPKSPLSEIEIARAEIHELKTALSMLAMYCNRFERSRPADDVLHALTVTVPRMCLEALNAS
jgi:hypothetical protein